MTENYDANTELQKHIDVEFDSIVTGNGLYEVDIAVNQLKRMYPDVVDIPREEISRFTLQRTMTYMLHLDQKFDMNATFSVEHYEKMKEQAKIYMDWLDSDVIEAPRELIYRPWTGEDDTEAEAEPDTVSADETVKPELPKQKEKATSGKVSNYQKGLIMYKEDIAANRPRSYTLTRMEGIGIPKATANVYYSKYKAERN